MSASIQELMGRRHPVLEERVVHTKNKNVDGVAECNVELCKLNIAIKEAKVKVSEGKKTDEPVVEKTELGAKLQRQAKKLELSEKALKMTQAKLVALGKELKAVTAERDKLKKQEKSGALD